MRSRIAAGTVVTGDETVYDDGAVLLDGDRIVAVGPDEDVPADDLDREFHLPGHAVLPGLIDCHVHLGSVGDPDRAGYLVGSSPAKRVVDTLESARRTVEAGVTTVRDVGSPADLAMAVRDEVAAGRFPGPRIVACGEGLTSTGGHGDELPWHLSHVGTSRKGRVANGVDEVLLAVREQLEMGADAIKVWASGGVIDPEGEIDVPEYSPEEMAAICEEAARHDVHVCAHAHPPSAIRTCVEAGVRSIEHGMYVDEACIEAMAAEGVYLVSTLSVMYRLIEADGVPDYYRTNTEAAVAHHEAVLPDAVEAGVPLAMGTDAGAPTYPHGGNAAEVACLADAGLGPLDAIEVATRGSAELLELDDVGVLRGGYAADLVAVDGDPLADVDVVTDPDNVDLVFADGRLVKGG